MRDVVAWRGAAAYPERAPFGPGVPYPEAPFGDGGDEPNAVYEAVRSCFELAGLDAGRAGRADWNPFRGLIEPGETVLLKPNWVKVEAGRWPAVVTHPSVVRAVADYVWLALGGKGRMVVADAPQTDSSFAAIERHLQLRELEAFYRSRGVDFTILDLRREEWRVEGGVVEQRRALAGDPAGYVAFDLGAQSALAAHAGAGRYYGADYDDREVNRHHSGGRHEYLLARTALEADVVLSLPKLKTHKKTGLTCGLKNLVGVNGDKNWLPHHTEPGWMAPGDERPPGGGWAWWKQRSERFAARALRRWGARVPGLGTALHAGARRAGRHVFGDTEEVVRSGNWWGNDTCWRMCLDLNRLVLYGTPEGELRETPARRYWVLADAVIAGEGAGPMRPDAKPAGLLLFGLNPAAVDAAAAVLMGFDPERIPVVREAFGGERLRLAKGSWHGVTLRSNHGPWNGRLPEIDPAASLGFRPHPGWQGALERGRGAGMGVAA